MTDCGYLVSTACSTISSHNRKYLSLEDQQLQKDSFESMIGFWTSHDINLDGWEASYCKLQQSLDGFIEGLNSVVNITGEDSRLEETLEDIKDTNSSTISAIIMPAISAATTAPIYTEQICGVTTSLSSAEYSQSVF